MSWIGVPAGRGHRPWATRGSWCRMIVASTPTGHRHVRTPARRSGGGASAGAGAPRAGGHHEGRGRTLAGRWRSAAANLACCSAARLTRVAGPAGGLGPVQSCSVVSALTTRAGSRRHRNRGGEEAHLPRALLQASAGWLAEAAAPDFLCALQLGAPRLLQGAGSRDPAPGPCPAAPASGAGCRSAGPGVQHRLGGALVAQQAGAASSSSAALDLLACASASSSSGAHGARACAAARRANVHAAPGSAAQRPLSDSAAEGSCANPEPYSAAAPSSGMPSARAPCSRSRRASSGFSRRNSRALSLPWPIFSPL